MSDRLTFIEEWGHRDPVGWTLEYADGTFASGPVVDGRIVGGKYDAHSVRDFES